MKARAATGHEIPERPPIQLRVGEPVMVGDRDTEWTEFVFISTSRGSGWVPARHLSNDHGAAVVEVPYDTTELPVVAGEEVAVLEQDDAGGWWWCRSEDGSEGWVPARVLAAD